MNTGFSPAGLREPAKSPESTRGGYLRRLAERCRLHQDCSSFPAADLPEAREAAAAAEIARGCIDDTAEDWEPRPVGKKTA